MSGMRGEARFGKIKVSVTITFADTGKRVRSNIFVKPTITAMEIIDRLDAKYGKAIWVETVKHKGWPLFQKEAA